jgi:hypothetical protein
LAFVQGRGRAVMPLHLNDYDPEITRRSPETYDLPESLERAARASVSADYTTAFPWITDKLTGAYYSITEPKLDPDEATSKYGIKGKLTFNEPITASGAARRQEKFIWNQVRNDIVSIDERDNGLIQHAGNLAAMIGPLGAQVYAEVLMGTFGLGLAYKGVSGLTKIMQSSVALSKVPLAAEMLGGLKSAAFNTRRIALAQKLQGVETGIRDLAVGVRTAPQWAFGAGEVLVFNGATELAVWDYANKYGLDYDEGQAALWLGVGVLAGGLLGQAVTYLPGFQGIGGKAFNEQRAGIQSLTKFTNGMLENARLSKEGYTNLLAAVTDDLANGRVPSGLMMRALLKTDQAQMAMNLFKENFEVGAFAKVALPEEIDAVLKGSDLTGLERLYVKATIANSSNDLVQTGALNLRGLNADERVFLKALFKKEVSEITIADIKGAIKKIEDESVLRSLSRQKTSELTENQIQELVRQFKEDLHENFYNPDKVRALLRSQAGEKLATEHKIVVDKLADLQRKRVKLINLKKKGYKGQVKAIESQMEALMDEYTGKLQKAPGMSPYVEGKMEGFAQLEKEARGIRRDYLQILKTQQKENVAEAIGDVVFKREEIVRLESLKNLLNQKLAANLDSEYAQTLNKIKEGFEKIIGDKNITAFTERFKELVKSLKDKKVKSLEQFYRLRPETREEIIELLHMVSTEKVDINLENIFSATDQEIEFFFGNHAYKRELDSMTTGEAMKTLKQRILDPEATMRQREQALLDVNTKTQELAKEKIKEVPDEQFKQLQKIAQESKDPELQKTIKELDTIELEEATKLAKEEAHLTGIECLMGVV